MPKKFIPAHGGYQKLLSCQKTIYAKRLKELNHQKNSCYETFKKGMQHQDPIDF